MAIKKNVVGRRRNLLIELGTEELPPKALKKLAKAFAERIFNGLVERNMVDNGMENYQYYATPRRLAVWVRGVLPKQPDSMEQRKGPAIQAAYDQDGNPTPAALGFAKSCGVAVDKLQTLQTDKGAWLTFNKKVRGLKLSQTISECLEESIRLLPIPKRMRWGSNEVEFVRPVHWLLALYGSDLVKTGVLGLKSDRYSYGHRFHAPDAIRIQSADRYLGTLKTSGYVIADYQARQSLIGKQLERIGKKQKGITQVTDSLLDEVTGLVEWPVAVLGEFDKRFLKLPSEVLISTMQDHQKYFHITDSKGKLKPLFITVSNIKSKSPKRVRQGNERVLRARLSDAEFFWHTDQKIALAERADALKGVLFHKKLGSIYDKCQRMHALSSELAKSLGADDEQVAKAVALCKSDLVTDMVGEFPELQGTIGRYYALNQGQDNEVANCIQQHYLPRFAGDELPTSVTAQCVALADRIDTLVGIFSCGEMPTGDKDPYALRRAALGVLRIVIEGKLNIDLQELLSLSADNYNRSALQELDCSEQNLARLSGFISDRLKGYFLSRDYTVEQINAVQACHPRRPLDFANRLYALKKFFNKQKSAALSLASANKRIANILAKVELDPQVKFDSALTSEQAERQLASNVDEIEHHVEQAFYENHYDQGFQKLALLKTPIDEFFDQVMVMHDDAKIKNNRLALLQKIRAMFLGVADISHIQIEK